VLVTTQTDAKRTDAGAHGKHLSVLQLMRREISVDQQVEVARPSVFLTDFLAMASAIH